MPPPRSDPLLWAGAPIFCLFQVLAASGSHLPLLCGVSQGNCSLSQVQHSQSEYGGAKGQSLTSSWSDCMMLLTVQGSLWDQAGAAPS